MSKIPCAMSVSYTLWKNNRQKQKINKLMNAVKPEDLILFDLDDKRTKYLNCSDADKDTCPPDDPNCLWRTHNCLWCKQDYKISKRALTGKYMIADHHKVCKEFKRKNK